MFFHLYSIQTCSCKLQTDSVTGTLEDSIPHTNVQMASDIQLAPIVTSSEPQLTPLPSDKGPICTTQNTLCQFLMLTVSLTCSAAWKTSSTWLPTQTSKHILEQWCHFRSQGNSHMLKYIICWNITNEKMEIAFKIHIKLKIILIKIKYSKCSKSV